jgi:hypothetical protein
MRVVVMMEVESDFEDIDNQDNGFFDVRDGTGVGRSSSYQTKSR